ncbi:MAG: hypothetical protein JHC95_18255 [Solirubrobacteraceae bacterium]|nr:hypothetical protein [Solirubrobacteraceae bacterium]
MKQTTSHRARLALTTSAAVLVAISGTAAAAHAIATDQSQAPDTAPQTDRLRYVAETVSIPPVSQDSVRATCPDGAAAVDGGLVSTSAPFTRVDASTATADGTGWQVDLWNQHPSLSLTAYVWAGCVAVG